MLGLAHRIHSRCAVLSCIATISEWKLLNQIVFRFADGSIIRKGRSLAD